MAPAWKVGWVQALMGSNPIFSARPEHGASRISKLSKSSDRLAETTTGVERLQGSQMRQRKCPCLSRQGHLFNCRDSSKPSSAEIILRLAKRNLNQGLLVIANHANVLDNQNVFWSKNPATQPSQTSPGFSRFSYPRSFSSLSSICDLSEAK